MATVLTSWKSIAQYMGTGVRTVQRWSTERGFPVRGTGNGHKRLVIALTEEIDEWVHSQSLHTSEAKGQSESEGEEALQEKIASLQSEIGRLRLQIDVMQMRREMDENQLESSEDVLRQTAQLLDTFSLLQKERRDVLDRCRSMRGWQADGAPLILSLLNVLNERQCAASALLVPAVECADYEDVDSADVPPHQLSANSTPR